MAENLGQAELELRVNLKSFENDLNKAQNLVRNTKTKFEFDTTPASIGLRRLEQSAKVLQAQFERLKAPSLNLTSKKLPDDLRVVNTELLNFTRNVLNGKTALESNISGLRQQGAAFATLAANVKVGTAEFKNFTQAAAQASQKQLFSGFEEIKALQQLFRDGGAGGFSSFRGTEDLLNFSSKVGNTTSSIQLYIRLLEQAKSVTALTDTNFARLTAEIERQSKSLDQASRAAERYNNSLKKPQLSLPPARSEAPFQLQPPSQAEQDAVNRQQRRQAKIEGIREYLSAGGRDTSVIDPSRAFAGPNSQAIQAEQQLAKQRAETAKASKVAAQSDLELDKQRRKQNRESIGNAVIGGAFPLLFGQGAGASLGGGIGGLLGGALGGNFGFGLSLVGTAVGTAIDSLNQRFKDLAIALESPVASFDKIKEASLLSSKAQENYAQALIDAGRSAEAAQLIQAEAARTIDPGNALLLAGSSDELGRSFSDLQDKISNFTSGAAVGFNSWLSEVIRIATGAPTAGTPLTGPQAVTAGNRQQLGGAALIGSGLGALALAASAPVSLPIALGIGAVGLGAAAFGAAGIEGGRQRNSVATSNEVKSAEAEIQSILERQKSTQDQINAAKAAGLTKTAELLQVSNQFQEADTAAAKARLQVQGQLAAGQINQATATQRLKDIEDARNTTGQNLVATQQAAAAAARRQLEDAQALQGLKGAELQIAQQLLQVDAARRNAQQANAAVSTAGASGASPAELEALKNAAQAAGDTLKTAIIAGADAIKEAAEQARVNFESAAKALQSTSESNFDFLDKETQDKVLAQARKDIAIGVEQGGIDKRFLDLGSNTEAILAAAQASRSQVDALDKFNAASAEYTTATNAAKDAISQLDSKLPEVQTNLANLETTVRDLVEKSWEVTVNVDATTGASNVQLG